MNSRFLAGASLALVLSACAEERQWQLTSTGLDEALMGIAGSSENDVWAVGADTGAGPLVLHFDGSTWERRATGTSGHLWWVHAFSRTSAFFGGARSTIVEWNGADFVRHQTPGLARQTVFGVWGSSREDVYAVGSGTSGRRGFLWHFDGTSWAELALPPEVPLRDGETPGLFKVWGSGPGDVWVVGGDGVVLHKTDAWRVVDSGNQRTLFTVHGNGKGTVYLCGGGAQAALFEGGTSGFRDISPSGFGLLQGIAADPTDVNGAWASGESGSIFHRTQGAWANVNHGLPLSVESLHATWVDPKGRVWAVGGNVLSDLTKGAVVRFAPKEAPRYVQPPKPEPPAVVCPDAQVDPQPNRSLARRWDEQILGAIRRDLPRPTVHARNLFHLSAAMWDAFAAYHPSAQGVFFNEKLTGTTAERDEALSYAAYRVLLHRYQGAIGGPVSTACFRAFMSKLGYSPDEAGLVGNTPAAVGNRIAKTLIDAHVNDGANETNNYADTTGFMSAQPVLPVEAPSAPVDDIDLWQPLDLAIAATQNGIPLKAGVQGYIGAHWREVRPFALTRPGPGLLYVDPGPNPRFTPATVDWAVEVIRRSHQLADLTATIDISPGAYGNNPLGDNSGTGHPMNPATGQPYAPQVVPLKDFGRVLAELWADGPKSETPPGHWNVIANSAFDHPAFERKWKGQGTALEPLEFDLRAYLALNGALHDAAIAAWEIKRAYLSSRPITLIRSSAARGQSSDPQLPSYDARGLPLIPGLIELVTAQSAAPGGRHEGLQNAVGQVVVNTWRGEPGWIAQVSGVGWLRAVEWVPYQRRDFVTPAFPGFISGHSTFSRAGAQVLTELTGSAYFPGGLGEIPVAAGNSLTFEAGPSQRVLLQFATYFDAADQAGQSRIWGGIHISPDDFSGRRVGAIVGQTAFAKAEQFYPP
ncbi:MAG: vanadium-dependent haloperoxidase [Archangium sp.]|nr:vanadium-dependent haloperoxidase [Archangium sp.]